MERAYLARFEGDEGDVTLVAEKGEEGGARVGRWLSEALAALLAPTDDPVHPLHPALIYMSVIILMKWVSLI